MFKSFLLTPQTRLNASIQSRMYKPRNRQTRDMGIFYNVQKRGDSSFRGKAHLPVLAELSATLKKNIAPMNDTVLIGVQHMLPTTVPLFEHIKVSLGISDIKLVGKAYSSVAGVEDDLRSMGVRVFPAPISRKPGQFQEQMKQVIHDMWKELQQELEQRKDIKRIIVLDEGGQCVDGMPKKLGLEYACAAIEQTRFGLYDKSEHSFLFPLIDVARCATKIKLEAPIIAKSVIRRAAVAMNTLGIDNTKVCGVVGNGAIGSALTRKLLKDGYKVIIYDSNSTAFKGIKNEKCYRVESIKQVVGNSDIVFGCTGKDISHDETGLITNHVRSPITFVSCSSKDIEFYSLLKEIAHRNSLQQSVTSGLSQLFWTPPNGHEITILENGFPINFDRTPASDPFDEIDLTRCLLLGAIAQARYAAIKPANDGITLNKGHPYHMLNVYIQRYIAKRWLGREQIKHLFPKKLREEYIKHFNDIEWISKNSSGTQVEDAELDRVVDPNILGDHLHKPKV